MALIYMETDTGGGANNGSNTSKVVKYNTPSAASYAQGQAALQRRLTPTANTSTAKKSATTTPAATQQAAQTSQATKNVYYNPYNTNYKNTYNPTTKDEGPSQSTQNYNAYLNLLNDLSAKQYTQMWSNANDYASDTKKYYDTAQKQYKSAYTNNTNLYNQLAAENAQREAAANQYATDYYNRVAQANNENKASTLQSISDYYNTMSQTNREKENATMQSINDYYNRMSQANKDKEAATLDAISNAYNNQMGNAGEYYNNVLATYNRSMDYIAQGFNEGKLTSQQARDAAIQLAQELYDMGEATQNRQTERGLKGQYISYMNGLKNLNQRLAAQGINGGASETAQLSALNGYEANRTDLQEARLAALGALRQTQMQSDSEANQTYLAKLADLIVNRTNQQLGVENTRSQGEYNYSNMKNSAESERGSQLVNANNNFQNWAANLEGNYANMYQTAQNNFQDWANQLQSNKANMTQNAYNNFQDWTSALENAYANMGITNTNNAQEWAANLANQRANVNNTYANAIADIASGRAGTAYNETQFENQAAQSPMEAELSAAKQNAIDKISEKDETANVGNSSDYKTATEKKKEAEKKKKEKEKKKKEEEKKKKAINNAITAAKTATTTSNTKKKKK